MSASFHILFTVAWFPNRMEPGDGVFIEKHARCIASRHKISVLMVKADYNENKKYHIDTEITEHDMMKIYRV